LENRLVLTGTICKAPETRYSPAGIPLTRFTLEHRSRQMEAGMVREALCRMIVMAAGRELKDQVERVGAGQVVTVTGFISRADSRQGQPRLVLHAQQIQAEI
jgi:primosomal replication protein N